MLFNPLRRYIILPIKRKRRTILNNSNALLAEFEQSWINFLSKKTYLTYRDDDHLKSMFSKNHELIILPWYLQFFAFKLKRKLAENREQASQIYNDEIKDYNKEFIKKRLARYKKFFDGTDGKPLNEEQRLAIVRDDIHNIVVAGAGSGKTEVLTKRIAYLTKRPDKVKPERILALAFQNKAASEISERLKQKYKTNVEVKTFHKLGNDILNHPNLMFSGNNTDNQQKKFIKEIFDGFLTKRDFQNKVINYMKLYSDSEVVKTEEDFTTKEDYYKYKRLLKYIALDSTPIKSEAEREIINFFITHNLNGKKLTICYEDEAEWMKYKNSDGKEIVPKPDFFFPDYNIYLEHWAIDKNGKVPDWFEGENPTEEYTKGINIKKAKYS